jgi:hypothetical protein
MKKNRCHRIYPKQKTEQAYVIVTHKRSTNYSGTAYGRGAMGGIQFFKTDYTVIFRVTL